MYDQSEHEILNKTELLAATEEIKILRELVKSQKSIIDNLEKKIIKDNQKLEIKTEELNRILMSGVSYEEAIAIAKQLLKDEHISSVLVAKLLSIIYNESVEATEIQGTVEFGVESNQFITQSKKVRRHYQKLHYQYTKFSHRFLAFTVILNQIKDQLNTSTPPPKIKLQRHFSVFFNWNESNNG